MEKSLINKKLVDIKNLHWQYIKLKDMLSVLVNNEELVVKFEKGQSVKYKKIAENLFKINSEEFEIDQERSWTDTKRIANNLTIFGGLIIEVL